MNQEHKNLILAALKEKKELLQAQSETITKQTELITKQSELIEKIMDGLVYSAETTRLMSHKIAELQADHQLLRLFPVTEPSFA